jgi:hypothetical protein
MENKNWKWFQYYWSLCNNVGFETYTTWKRDLLISVVLGLVVAVLTGNWKDFRTVLAATGIVLGLFIIWHVLRAPWLLHKSQNGEWVKSSPFAGVFGFLMIAAVLVGGLVLGRVLWAARQAAAIEMTLKAPTPPAITINRTAPPVKEQCWVRNYAVPAISSQWGLATILCNRTIKPPYSVELDYDQTVTLGPFTFPVGSEFQKSMLTNEGTKAIAYFYLHTIFPNEPFSIMAKGATDKFPLFKVGTIRAKGLVLELHP